MIAVFDTEDLAMCIMAAFAFNMGIGAREDRDPEIVQQLDDAIKRVQAAGRIVFDFGDDA